VYPVVTLHIGLAALVKSRLAGSSACAGFLMSRLFLTFAFAELTKRSRASTLQQGVEFHIAPEPFRELLAVGFPERADAGSAFLVAKLAILVPALVIKTVIAVCVHCKARIGCRTLIRAVNSIVRYLLRNGYGGVTY